MADGNECGETETGPQLLRKLDITLPDSSWAPMVQIDVHPHEPWVLCTRTGCSLLQVWNYEDGTQVASGEVQERVGEAKFLMQRDWFVVQDYSRRRFDIYEMKSSNWQHVTRVEQSPDSASVYGSMAVHESLPYILTSNGSAVILLHWRQNWEEIQLGHHCEGVTAVAFHPIESGIFASSGYDYTIKIWDVDSMSIIRTFYTERRSIVKSIKFCGRFSKRSLMIAAHCANSTTPGVARVFDFRRGVCLAELTGHSAGFTSAFLHPRLPYLFSASGDGEIRVWSELDYHLVASYICESTFLTGIALCKNSDLLIVGGLETFSVMEVKGGRKTWVSETRMEEREKEAAHAKLDLETKIRNVVVGMELKRQSEIIDDLRAQHKEEERTQAERVVKLELAVSGLKAAVQSLEAEGTSVKDERAALLEKLERSELELKTKIRGVVSKMKLKCRSEIIDDLRTQHQEEMRAQAERVLALELVVNGLKAVVQTLEAEGTRMKDERAALLGKLEMSKLQCEKVIEEFRANHQPNEKAQKERQQPQGLGTEADKSETGAEELKTVVEKKLEMTMLRVEQLECERAELLKGLDKSDKRIENLESKMELAVEKLERSVLRSENLECERAELLEKLEKSDKRIEKLAQRFAEELSLQEPLREYSLREVQGATNNFDPENKRGIGSREGSCLYRGKLCDGTLVLVKKSGTLSCMQEMHPAKFKTEVVDILLTLQHPHLLTLLGVCYEGGCLVFEHTPNGSVKEWIGNVENPRTGLLPSHVRFRIMVEVARAVHFLHSSRLANGGPIILRAIKPENIFVDGNFVAKIGDVDQALLVPEKRVTQKSTKGSEDEGSNSTFLFLQANAQYVAPELWQSRVFDEKTDVYALGVTILEMLTGKFGSAIGVIQGAMEEEEDAAAFETALDHSAGAWDVELAKEVAKLGLRCVSLDRRNRPNMMEEGVGILPVLEGVALKVVVAEAAEVNEKL
ncbi:hypothetical protein CBR_g8122 [Chara braunii]|uniref:Protein kinase domain-containing protein n=1 Tax=Chara braunii TaxID=69332 RepID=A0A388KLA0_CHABU|nr:hypothetical protein CBR_g8122 [Chara braunii]|eukprot:GBG70822.1 hypothetical protein CBR_g8122 [Chara braunii]